MEFERYHNELLCFVTNKLNSMPFEMIVKVCTDFYQEREIREAKDQLWDVVISKISEDRKDLRKKKSLKQDKKKSDMEDILKALLICDKEGTRQPLFYAINLGNLPPVTIDSVDVSAMSCQIIKLQEDMAQMRQL